MRKPSLSDALAQKQSPAPQSVEPTPAPTLAIAPKARDGRVTTTLRIEPGWLEALKIVAAKRRVKVNDLLLEGAAHVLALNGQKPS